MNAAAFTARAASDMTLVDLDIFPFPPTDPVAIRPHHGCAELVQDAEGGLVPAQSELSLKLYRGHALRLTGDQTGGLLKGVRLRAMTVPTVNPVWRRQARQVSTPGRVARRQGSPTTPQRGQANPSPQRDLSR